MVFCINWHAIVVDEVICPWMLMPCVTCLSKPGSISVRCFPGKLCHVGDCNPSHGQTHEISCRFQDQGKEQAAANTVCSCYSSNNCFSFILCYYSKKNQTSWSSGCYIDLRTGVVEIRFPSCQLRKLECCSLFAFCKGVKHTCVATC